MKTISFLAEFIRDNLLPMGSPISDILAEMKLRILEEQIKIKYKEEIKYWFRYIDNIFAVLNKDIEPKKLLESINKEDKNIKFTKEIEKEGKLNYLDVKIIRIEDGKIEKTVYRKPNSISEIISNKYKTP